MMSDQTDNLNLLLKPFGLSEEESSIYLWLLAKGVKSALQISRDLHIARTKVYRILDKLYGLGLVNRNFDYRGFKFGANSYQKLELLVAQKEEELNSLKKVIPQIFDKLAPIQGLEKSKTKVLYYTGLDGLKQVTWNSLHTKDELLIFEVGSMSTFLDYKFCDKVREEFVLRGIHIREITNQKKLESWTEIEELPRKFWHCRYISPKELEMKFEVLIYNDVYAIYNFSGDDIFCVEIYNEKLAQMQKQIFNYLWNQAKKMKIIGKGGKCQVET